MAGTLTARAIIQMARTARLCLIVALARVLKNKL